MHGEHCLSVACGSQECHLSRKRVAHTRMHATELPSLDGNLTQQATATVLLALLGLLSPSGCPHAEGARGKSRLVCFARCPHPPACFSPNSTTDWENSALVQLARSAAMVTSLTRIWVRNLPPKRGRYSLSQCVSGAPAS